MHLFTSISDVATVYVYVHVPACFGHHVCSLLFYQVHIFTNRIGYKIYT